MFNNGGSMNHVKIFMGIWSACMISVISVFGLFKLGSYMFHVEPSKDTPTPTQQNIAECWKAGGVPEMDTNGDYDDFKTCKKEPNLKDKD